MNGSTFIKKNLYSDKVWATRKEVGKFFSFVISGLTVKITKADFYKFYAKPNYGV